MDLICNFLPGDPRLVEHIVKELKSQGIFDQFRKECISDVDTKPAYQNLRQRVEGSVSSFLKEQTWTPDMNKNQIREMLRKHIHESGFLETGVERIVDQVVNPKINSVFLPKVEDVMYKFLGIERPKEKVLAPLEIHTIHDLLPKDLEAVSPEIPDEKDFLNEEHNEDKVGQISLNVNNEKVLQEDNSVDSQSSVLSGIVSHDSNQSLKQDSSMSLNSSESRMSLSENILKIESEDTILSHKSSDSISKTEQLSDEKVQPENENTNKNLEKSCPSQDTSEKNSDESKTKSRDANDKKKEKYHSSTERSKSRSDKEKDKTKSDKHKNDEKDKDGKSEKYKIPKLSHKNKDSKSKEKDDKYHSDKGKSDKDRKSDKERKSKHSSEKESDKNKKDKSEKRDKDEKRDKKDSSRSDKSKDDKRSSSSKKRDSSSSKDNHKDKDKETSLRNKEETSEKNKNGHNSSSSSSRKDSKSRRDEEKSKTSHKKDDKNDKEDRKRKRKSKDDHYSSKDKRSGGRSSDRDSDGPSSNKKIHVSPQSTSGEYSNEQTNQDTSGLNSEGSSGYSGNSDRTEEKPEETTENPLVEIQNIKLPKFASNYHEAMKIMKTRKLLKKLESIKQPNPKDPEVQKLLLEIKDLTKDFKKDKKEIKEKEDIITVDKEINEHQGVESSKPNAGINIEEFISSSNISMAKWNALEAKLMEQITDVDYNSYESPYMDDDDDEVTLERKTAEVNEDTEVDSKNDDNLSGGENEEFEDATMDLKIIETENEVVIDNLEEPEISLANIDGDENLKSTEDSVIIINNDSVEDDFSKHTTEAITVDAPQIEPAENNSIMDSSIPRKFKDFKQRAIVLLRKHSLTEELIKMKNEDNVDEPKIQSITDKQHLDVIKMDKENIKVNNTTYSELDEPVENLGVLGNRKECNKNVNMEKAKSQSELHKLTIKEDCNTQNLKETLTKEQDENNLGKEESFSENIDIYSLQNSCEVCLDSKGDIFRGFEPSENLRSLNIINYIINILEDEISKSKKIIALYDKNHESEYQTRKRKVDEKKTDTSNNNFDDPASKRLEVEEIKINPKNISPLKRIHPHTNSKMKAKLMNKTENKNVAEKIEDHLAFGTKSGRKSIASECKDNTANSVKSPNKSNQATDGSSDKKNRTSQRYASEDLYKPRMCLRRNGRDFKNP